MSGNMYLIIGAIVLVLGLCIKPLRKATGLVSTLLGLVACFSGVGIVIGIPMIFVGGILLFI